MVQPSEAPAVATLIEPVVTIAMMMTKMASEALSTGSRTSPRWDLPFGVRAASPLMASTRRE
jgi:hypothetical protein